jgi:magnesium-transporting ATPase (P-type)
MTSLVTAAGTPLPSEIPQDPSTLDAGAVVAALGTDAERGLGSDEAAARLAHGGPNRLAAQEPVPAWRRLAAQFADPLIYLLLASIVVSLIAWLLEGAHGLPIEAIVIALIVVGNGVLGFLQERQAEQAVAALQRAARR